MQELNFTPLIIIGAGRSGTNMLRDIITTIPKFTTWDCDEINPIWRYGNRDFATDELKPEHLNDSITKFIRSRFIKINKSSKADFVVEKTCANSLRMAYVNAIFPEAKFIVINRDGRDVVPSAMKRWNASFELKYTLKKLKYVPKRDFLYHVSRFGVNRLKKMFNPDASLSFWGPLYKGIEDDVQNLSLMGVCANQWKNCAESVINQRADIHPSRILDYNYEAFVKNPKNEIKRLESFLDIAIEDPDSLVQRVTDKSVGSHEKIFNEKELLDLNTSLTPTLKKLGYVAH